jgi:Fe-S oxidoreductase
VTRDERDVTRGRANTLRLAISGQLGADALASDEMAETLKLCVSCKACRRECPTGVDMARMKIEVLAARARYGRLGARERLIAYLPRYAGLASRLPALINMRDRVPLLAKMSERLLGLAAARSLPSWRRDCFRSEGEAHGPEAGPEVALFADTFNATFEREKIDAALRVLVAAGYRVHVPKAAGGRICCGRTFLAAGLVDEARFETSRSLAVLAPFAARNIPIVGLEPSCLLTFRDEAKVMRLGESAGKVAGCALLFEEFVARERDAGRFKIELAPIAAKALLHGHCHQKSFGAMAATEKALRLIPGLNVQTIESSCCGMAGAFGYQAETYEMSLAMGELSLLPRVREAEEATLIVADGFSCRHQIRDATKRAAIHVVEALDRALAAGRRAAR